MSKSSSMARMARAIRPPPGDEAVPIALRLPRGLHERLKAAAGEDGNVSAEVRRRLERSLEITDARTEDLVSGIAYVTSTLSLEGDWWGNPFLFRVVLLAVNELLALFEVMAAGGSPDRSHKLFGEGVSAEDAARMLVTLWSKGH